VRPCLLDLFCGAGGATMGYHRAGFEVVGVDIAPQPHYPFEFHQGDATTWPLDGFDAIHASPPCQRFSALCRATGTASRHPDLIEPIRQHLTASGLPWVMENVEGAPMQSATICGAAMGLEIVRHRQFETNWLLLTPGCAHNRGDTITGKLVAFREGSVKNGRHLPPRAGRKHLRPAMGCDWMTQKEADQAIPPAYTEFIGEQLLALLAAP
jgi:C-5 cytosine-specific DNA methylase